MNCISPVFVRKVLKHVPCGKCAFCLKKAIDAWCLRLLHEMEDSTSAFFITLTYNDEHLPSNGQLSKRDLQLFIKRLRKRNTGIRYFAVGEYGSNYLRPHYHAVIFNLDNLELVTECWKDSDGKDIGFVVGDRATPGRIRYMVSYMATPPPEVHPDAPHIEPPFRIMSRNPGLGNCYVKKGSIGIDDG